MEKELSFMIRNWEIRGILDCDEEFVNKTYVESASTEIHTLLELTDESILNKEACFSGSWLPLGALW